MKLTDIKNSIDKAKKTIEETDAADKINEDATPSTQRDEWRNFGGAKRTLRQQRIGLVLLAAGICLAIVYIVSHHQAPAAPQGDNSAAPAKAQAAISWQTAGKDYSGLYAAIEKIAKDNPGGGPYNALAAGNATVSPAAEPTQPSTPEPPAGGAGNANGSSGNGAEAAAPENTIPPEGGYAGDTLGAAEPAPPAVSGGDLSGTEDSGPSGDYSDTNVQVAGVQEADVIKTDGMYIYAINSENLVIVSANNGNPELVAKIPQVLDQGQVYFEMYVTGDRLIAIRQGYNPQTYAQIQKDQNQGGSADAGRAAAGIVYPGSAYKVDTSVDIFDISDKASPKKLHTLSQSGSYRDSRMIDGMLYLISEYTDIDAASAQKDDPGTYVPLYSQDGAQLTAQPDDIVLRPNVTWPAYTNISGIDAVGKGGFVSKKSLFGSTDIVYANQGSLYLASGSYHDNLARHDETYNYYKSTTDTMLARLTLSGGKVDIAATAEIPGTLNGQFSLDEKDGVLRAVTTETENDWADFITPPQTYDEKTWANFPAGTTKTTNALYTYDGQLKKIGGVSGLAEGEQVYSCRFIGDACYFVTFRQTDPLFSVDVSDPKAPKVLGTLKIPGFSQYLHPYTANLLLGLGNDANSDTGAVGNLKLSMFDITNPADVTEKDKL
ncbi:MAG: beta-propeller domain-containing protein, partial [Clostridiales bacterium]|nr:beta-propeller domain-containing protein [Clostridiales bacterium]